MSDDRPRFPIREKFELVGRVIHNLPKVRAILRYIAHESGDEYSREQAARALKLLEIHDAR